MVDLEDFHFVGCDAIARIAECQRTSRRRAYARISIPLRRRTMARPRRCGKRVAKRPSGSTSGTSRRGRAESWSRMVRLGMIQEKEGEIGSPMELADRAETGA